MASSPNGTRMSGSPLTYSMRNASLCKYCAANLESLVEEKNMVHIGPDDETNKEPVRIQTRLGKIECPDCEILKEKLQTMSISFQIVQKEGRDLEIITTIEGKVFLLKHSTVYRIAFPYE